jgi:hypothetical protein
MLEQKTGGTRYEVVSATLVQPLVGQPILLHPGVVGVEAAEHFVEVTLVDQARQLLLIPGEIARLEHAGKAIRR